MFMSLFGRKKLCNLLCQPDKLLGCLAAPEYRAACAYILQRSLSLRCVPLSSPLPSPLPQSWRVHRVPTSAGHSDPIPAGIASQLSGSLRPTLAGHCIPFSAGHCDSPSAGHCDLTRAGTRPELYAPSERG